MVKIVTGEDLRIARNFFKLKQKEMAKYFGVARSTYAIWETKYRNKAFPREKYIPEIEAIEYWIPKKAEEKEREKIEKMTVWQQIKWFIKTLLFLE